MTAATAWSDGREFNEKVEDNVLGWTMVLLFLTALFSGICYGMQLITLQSETQSSTLLRNMTYVALILAVAAVCTGSVTQVFIARAERKAS